VCREHDLKQSEVEGWVDTFLKGGERSLKARPEDEQAAHEAEVRELRAKIEELCGVPLISAQLRPLMCRRTPGWAHDLDVPMPRHEHRLDGQQVLSIVRHNESRAGFEGAGNYRVVVGIAGNEIHGVRSLHYPGDLGQSPMKPSI
jgi:hypothetical protein